MKQRSLQGFEKYGRTTRRAQFLFEMDRIVPWSEVCAVIEPVYPKGSQMGGRPPVPLERMVRIYFLQQWFSLSDPAVEEALILPAGGGLAVERVRYATEVEHDQTNAEQEEGSNPAFSQTTAWLSR